MRIVLDPHWRRMDELFSPAALQALAAHDVVWGRDTPIPAEVLEAAWPDAEVLIAASPAVSREALARAPRLRAIVEVSGAFPDTIDYAACFERGVEVLSCAPGFRAAVAEMGLGMALAAARGLVREHEAFRSGHERWLEDCAETDFTLYGAPVGFVGFGQIAQEMARLFAPFQARLASFDPWLPAEVAEAFGVELLPLGELAAQSRVLFVTAVPTAENRGMIGADILRRMPDRSLLVLLSRAHLVDFDAVVAEAASGRIAVATDVFPTEPLAADHEIRNLPNVILSPHRAAAVPGGRHLIGDLILRDLAALAEGREGRELTRANPDRIGALAGVGDAAEVGKMAERRT